MITAPRLSCRRAKRLLLVQTSDARPAALAAHLTSCPACAAFAARLDAQTVALQALRSETPFAPGSLAVRALTRWEAERHTGAYLPTTNRSWRLVGASAAFVGAATVGGVAWRGFAPAPPSTSPHPVTSVAVVPTPQPRSVASRPTTKLASLVPPAPRIAVQQPTVLSTPRRPRTVSRPPSRLVVVPTPRGVVPFVLPRVVPAPSPASDAVFLRPDNADFARRWAAIAPTEASRIESELRASIRGGDDFVDVPFPRIALADDARTSRTARTIFASALGTYRQEREIVDARLQRRVTLGLKRVSFADLCDELTKQTGVTFTAARGVADDKITIFCTNRPARDLLREVARLFNFAWERLGEEGEYRYRLKQPLQAQLLEEELRNKDQAEALLALDRDMQQYKSLLSLTPEEARARIPVPNEEENKRLINYAEFGYGAINLYFGLSSDQMNQLRAGKPLLFASPGSTGNTAASAALNAATGTPDGGDENVLSPEISQRILQTMDRAARVKQTAQGTALRLGGGQNAYTKDDGEPPSHIPGMGVSASLYLSESELGRYSLMGGSGIVAPGKDGGRGGSASMNMGIGEGISPSSRDPKNAEHNKDLANRPDLKNKADFRDKSNASDKTDADKPFTTADLLEAIHKATGRDVIGDYYTRLLEKNNVLVNADTLFDALNRASDKARLRWGTEDEWLTFRSVSFFHDRLKEVPNRLLDRWVSRREKDGSLSFASLAEMASLTDAQLNASAVGQGIKALYGLKEWDIAQSGNLRSGWRLVAELSPGTRRDLLGTGVAFEQMTLAQQEAFARAIFGDSRSPQATGENLAGARLTIFYGPKPIEPGTKSADKPEYTTRFVYRYHQNNEALIRAITPSGASAGRDTGKIPEIW